MFILLYIMKGEEFNDWLYNYFRRRFNILIWFKGKERILKGKENQKNRIIKERINSLKDFSYVLPYNDFRKLNIFLNSENEEVVNIAIKYIKHKYNEFAKNINDSNSSTSHMSMFNKYWKSEYIEGTDLYLELFNWKQKVIK